MDRDEEEELGPAPLTGESGQDIRKMSLIAPTEPEHRLIKTDAVSDTDKSFSTNVSCFWAIQSLGGYSR